MEDRLLKEMEVLRVREGDVLVVRPTLLLTMQDYATLAAQLKDAQEKVGVKFVILDGSMEVVAVQEAK